MTPESGASPRKLRYAGLHRVADWLREHAEIHVSAWQGMLGDLAGSRVAVDAPELIESVWLVPPTRPDEPVPRRQPGGPSP
jgi:hypothetical protein